MLPPRKRHRRVSRRLLASCPDEPWRIGHDGTGGRPFRASLAVDAGVIEAPKLHPHRQAIRERLATALGLPAVRVNVKASSGERIGFVGRGEGVAALAVATLAHEA